MTLTLVPQSPVREIETPEPDIPDPVIEVTPATEEQKILLEAASLLESNGWCREELVWDGKFCLVGAMGAASGGANYYDDLHDGERDLRQRLISALYPLLRASDKTPGMGYGVNGDFGSDRDDYVHMENCLIRWNDSVKRRRYQVINLFQRAALRLGNTPKK